MGRILFALITVAATLFPFISYATDRSVVVNKQSKPIYVEFVSGSFLNRTYLWKPAEISNTWHPPTQLSNFTAAPVALGIDEDLVGSYVSVEAVGFEDGQHLVINVCSGEPTGQKSSNGTAVDCSGAELIQKIKSNNFSHGKDFKADVVYIRFI